MVSWYNFLRRPCRSPDIGTIGRDTKKEKVRAKSCSNHVVQVIQRVYPANYGINSILNSHVSLDGLSDHAGSASDSVG